MLLRRRTLLTLVVLAGALLALNTATADMMYGLESREPAGGAPTYLYSFDDNVSGSVTNRGVVTLNGTAIDADALAWSANNGLVAFSVQSGGANSAMLAIDPDTAVATPKGFSYAGRDIRGAVFDGADNLWVVDAAQDQLLRIDLSDGGIEQIVSLTRPGMSFDLSNCTDVAIARDGTFFLVSTYDVYTIDLSTGALTFQHNFGPSSSSTHALAGMAFSTDGPDDILFGYEINGYDDIYQYDINNGFASTTFALNFIPDNAGRGDLASITPVPVPGAVLLGLLGLSAAGVRLRKRG